MDRRALHAPARAVRGAGRARDRAGGGRPECAEVSPFIRTSIPTRWRAACRSTGWPTCICRASAVGGTRARTLRTAAGETGRFAGTPTMRWVRSSRSASCSCAASPRQGVPPSCARALWWRCHRRLVADQLAHRRRGRVSHRLRRAGRCPPVDAVCDSRARRTNHLSRLAGASQTIGHACGRSASERSSAAGLS